MRKAIKKPVEISYMTFDETMNDIKSYCSANWEDQERASGLYIERLTIINDELINIRTLEGDNQRMTKEDVLIIGIKGEPYPCKIDIFKETYDYEGEIK